MKSVIYLTCTKLPCIGVSQAPVVLCVKDTVLLVFGTHTLSGRLLVSTEINDDCSSDAYWRYTISYDETLLVDPETLLTSDDITGLFCETCFTDWIQELIQDNLILSASCSVYVSTYEELVAAASGELTIFVCGPITLLEDLVINTSIRFEYGGIIETDGFTLTVNGSLEAGQQQIFRTAGAEVVFGPLSTQYVLLEWFGAVGDGVVDDTAAVQLAVNRAAAANLTVTPLVRTYSISTIICPSKTNIVTLNPKRSVAEFKARAAAAMFTITSLVDSFVTFEGVMFNANALATSVISIVSSDNVYIRRCGFKGTSVKAISITAGIFIHVDYCEFTGAYSSDVIYLTGFCAAVYIERNNFGGSCLTYNIYADSSMTGDALLISDNTFGTASTLAAINIQGNSAINSVKSVIRNCRVDQTCITAHIVVGRYAWGLEITGCSLVDPAPYNILTDAGYTAIANNWLAQATIACIGLTLNSNFCHIGFNVNNAGAAYVIDTSTYGGALGFNKIERPIRKSGTADRGNGAVLTSKEYGVMYLDTDLDPDGKPIWWNGVAWVDATGLVV